MVDHTASPLLELSNVHCCYGGTTAVYQLSLRVMPGQIACLLGPSGCGKTTTLRAIAGFEPLCNGEIRVRGEPLSLPGYVMPPEKRRMGMVFQDYALFPHLNIYDNITFGLRRLNRRERRRRADELLELVDLQGYGDRFPHELSGGQQQRVSLARAVAPQPQLVLLDEPFSNLDVELRERLSREFHDIFRDQQMTAILVTHDQHEAFAMADEIGLMRDGRIVQWDTPFNLYHEPADRFAAEFIGQGSMISGTLIDGERIQTSLGTLRGSHGFPWPAGTRVDVLLRPDDVRMGEAPSGLYGRVVKKAFKGAETLYTLRTPDGVELLALAPSHSDYAVGDDVGLTLDTEHLVAFPADGEVPAEAERSPASAQPVRAVNVG